jgi:hypothetical protein
VGDVQLVGDISPKNSGLGISGLKELCRLQDLSTDGKKPELIE